MVEYKNEYLDTIHGQNNNLIQTKYRLDDLSVALEMIGLKDLAYELRDIASVLDIAVSKINEAVSKNIFDMVRTQEQASVNMINAALVMCVIKNQEDS